MRSVFSAFLLALAACAGAAAPGPSAPAPAPHHTLADEADVLAVLTRLFEGMRAGDSAAVRAAFDTSARLMSVAVRDGVPVVGAERVDEFVRSVGTPHAERWDERIWDPRVSVDGRLAAVWTPYAFYLGDRLSHCGVDSFQLFKGRDGWKIVYLADTRRRDGCAPPPAAR